MAKDRESKILYSCYFNRSREGEQFVPEHVFSLQVAGTLVVQMNEEKHAYQAGDFRLSRRNSLSKYEKIPPEEGEFKSLSVYLDQEILQEVSRELKLFAEPEKAPQERVILLPAHPLYQSYMDSLLVYLQLAEEEQQTIMNLKVKEAIYLLLKVNPALKNFLFDFKEPGKIDLEAFMQRHYHFNVQLQRFAYLSGRSLSTFKRDFEKIFKMTPSKWLIKRRLEEACFLLKEKRKMPSEIYLEVGFENLSHFSRVFKEQYGQAPTKFIQ